MWADFQDEVEQIPREMVKLTADDASTLTCLECGDHTFETPGCRGWGTSCCACQSSVSLSAPEPDASEKVKKKFRAPFNCFFCRRPIGYNAPYYRMPDPRGGVNKWNGQDKVVYLHGDGEKCVGKIQASDSGASCTSCERTAVKDKICDVMGAGKPNNMFCEKCKYAQRACMLGNVQTNLEKERIERETDSTPRKSKKRARTEEDA